MTVIFSGAAGIQKYEKVLAHQIMDYKAGTYHSLTFARGIEVLVNDFGVRCVMKVPEGVSAYDLPAVM
jgi:hypothetical protein